MNMNKKTNASLKVLICICLACLTLFSSTTVGAVDNETIEVQDSQPELQTESQSDLSDETQNLILGDANLNEDINLLDAITIQKYSISEESLNDIQKLCADVDRNNSVNLLDSILIQKFLLGMLSDNLGIGLPITQILPTDPESEATATETESETDLDSEPTDPVTETQPQTDPVTETQPQTDPVTDTQPQTDPVTDTATDPIIIEPTEPDTVELNKTAITLGVGENYTLIKSSPTGSDLTTAVFSSDNKDIVTVSESDGILTAKNVGTATITVTTKNGASASCAVTVKKAPTSISLNKTSLTLGVGETFDLNSSLPSGEAAYSIVYSSDNSSIAGVKAAGGLVTANKVGTATVTATTYNGKTVTCAVTVKNAPTAISLNKSSLTLRIGEYFDLNSSLPSGQAAYSILYSSSNPSVASVKAAGGLVCAANEGTATITARTYNNITATCTIKVEKIPSKIQAFVNKALSYKGKNYSHFISAMSMYGAQKGDAWCAWFVSTISKESGLSNIIPISGGAGSIPRIGVSIGAGTWYEGHNSVPRVGDIIVFTWNGLGCYPGQDRYFSDHVGIVYKVDNEYVYTVEGNATEKSPADDEPIVSDPSVTNLNTKVYCRQYKLYSGLINGYYRPNY